jgi:hypothetical protein
MLNKYCVSYRLCAVDFLVGWWRGLLVKDELKKLKNILKYTSSILCEKLLSPLLNVMLLVCDDAMFASFIFPFL